MNFIRPLYIPLLALALIASGCQSDQAPEPPGGTTTEDEGVWVSLTVSAPRSSRANPSPGEAGDGPEVGIWKENDIDNLNIFFFHDPEGKGLDAEADIHTAHYLDAEAIKKAVSETGAGENGVEVVYKFCLPKDETELKNGDKMAVVANAGKLEGITTLAALRNKPLEQTWTPSNEGFDKFSGFTMANALPNKEPNKEKNNGIVEIDPKNQGSLGNSFSAKVVLERTAARVDFMYNTSSNVMAADASALKYKMKDEKYDLSGVADIYVTHILPVNVMQQGSYILKHVTEEGNTNMKDDAFMCIDETAESGRPTNCVVEPTSIVKGSDKEDLDAMYDDTRAAKYSADSFTTANGIATIINDFNWEVSESGFDGYNKNAVVCYANENTHPQGLDNLGSYSTGLLFRAVFVPKTVYSDAACETISTGYEYTAPKDGALGKGKTFWRYSPTRDDMTEKDCIYFDNEPAALTYAEQHHQDRARIDKFTDGVCYYNLWLRHAGSDGSYDRPMPMEFVTVRNNIYRVGISFTGAGLNNVTIREPYNIRSRIFVKPWLLRQVEEIIL